MFSNVENREVIEENVKSLESIIKLLVPDLLEEDEKMPVSRSSSPSDFREHGFHSTGEVNITLSIDFGRGPGDTDSQFPEVKIHLNDDIRVLRDSAEEFMGLASKHHRPVLSEYLEVNA